MTTKRFRMATVAFSTLVGLALGLAARAAFRDEPAPELGPVEDSLSAMERPGEEPGAMVHRGHEVDTEAPEEAAGEPRVPEEVLIDLGNEKCPVMGGTVNPEIHSVWNGLRIGHCCPPCRDKLLANPEELLDGAGIEWREAAELAERIAGAEGEERARLIREAEKRWAVVAREKR